MKLRKILAAVLTAAMIFPSLSVKNVSAAEDVSIMYYFGPIMARYLINNEAINPDQDGTLTVAELQNITEINIPEEVGESLYDKDIRALRLFPNIKTLRFNHSRTFLRNVDLSGFPSLEFVECYDSKVSYFSITGCPTLRHLEISNNENLASVNLTECPNLNYLNVANTGIATIYIANNPLLIDAYTNNQYELTEPYYGYGHGDNTLVVNSNCQIITTPYTDGVPLDSAHFPDMNLRIQLGKDVDTNQDGYLQSDEISNFKTLSVSSANNISDVTGIEYLTGVESFYSSGDYSSVNLSGFSNLRELRISYNNILTDIDISNNSNLAILDLKSTAVTAIYVQNNPILLDVIQNERSHIGNEGEADEYLYYERNHQEVIKLPANCAIYQNSPSSSATPLEDGVSDGILQFCERLYTVVLGRPCDTSGRNFWANSIKNGVSGASAANSFFFSEEYTARGRSNSEYVDDLYHTFMNRSASPEEISYWADLLSSGAPRESIFTGFITSPEWHIICRSYGINPGAQLVVTPDESAVEAFTTRMYTTCLGREVDEQGAAYWASMLVNRSITGTALAHEFFFSDEFVGANHSDSEFVSRLYQTFMGRDGTNVEMSYWVERISDGASREDIFNGFATSTEFADLCMSAGINP